MILLHEIKIVSIFSPKLSGVDWSYLVLNWDVFEVTSSFHVANIQIYTETLNIYSDLRTTYQ